MVLGGNLVLQWQDGGQQPGSTPASLDLALDKYTRAAEGVSAGYSDLAGLVGALAAAGLGESAAQSASGQEAPAPGAQHGAAGRRDDDPTRGPRGGRGEAEPAYVRDAGGLRDPGYAVGDRDRYPLGLAPARGGAMPGEQGCERGGGGGEEQGKYGSWRSGCAAGILRFPCRHGVSLCHVAGRRLEPPYPRPLQPDLTHPPPSPPQGCCR